MTRKKSASADAKPNRSSNKEKSNLSVVTGASGPKVAVPLGEILLDRVDFHPRNYRKFYDSNALAEFSAGIRALGKVISPITVRMADDNRYQLVVGERRVRAARLAGFVTIPAVIGDFTDDQIEEIQLQENIQREDPHPMHEAESISRMYARGLNTLDISMRLGKSVTWVYGRHRLSGLILDIQDMFLAGVFTLSQAQEIADLSVEAQQSFYEQHCKSWQQRPPRFYNLSNTLANFKCDLSHALFDLGDGELYKEAGACTGCQFNTAFKGLLIPDTQGNPMCTRRSCYEKKTTLQLTETINSILTKEEPVALLIDGELSNEFKVVLDAIPGITGLPVYQVENITLIDQPEKPDIQDYQFEPESNWDHELDETEDEVGEAGEPSDDPSVETFDREGFEAAEQEYANEMISYEQEISNGKALKGFLLSMDELKIVFYYPVSSGKRLKAKDGKAPNIKDLIAAKQDTPEILQAEIKRIQTREARYKELDQEKIQKQVHVQLVEATKAENVVFSLTDQDRLAARWLIFHALPWDVRGAAEDIAGVDIDRSAKPEQIYQAISKMTDSQFSGLIRMALSGIPDSKTPTSITGYYLKQVAIGAGVNTDAIEKKQKEKAQTRQDNQEVRIAIYKKRIKRHERKEAA